MQGSEPPGRLGRLASAAQALRRAVLESGTATQAEVRRAAYDGSGTDAAVAAYVALVDQHAYRVTEARLSALREAGLSDDGIFEVTVAAALGAARRRFDSSAAILGLDADP